MQTRRSNLVPAAAVLGGCMVLAAAIFVGGMWFALDHAAARLGVSVRDAGESVSIGGKDIAQSLDRSGEKISRAQVTMTAPLKIDEPLKVRGVADDGAMPINARIAK